MSKVTNLNVIKEAATQTIENYGSELLEYLTMEEAVTCFTLIYVTNDITTGFGQDFTGNISVISSPTRISIIFLGHHSFYKVHECICLYEDLEEDMDAIRITMDAALARWEEQR